MAQQYQGQNVTNVRDARQGDPGFVQGQDQVVVTMPDGSQRTVARSEVSGTPD